MAYFLYKFLRIWATFYSDIWSHCLQITKVHLKGKIYLFPYLETNSSCWLPNGLFSDHIKIVFTG